MMKAAAQFISGVGGIEGIEVVGAPEMTVVAFKAAQKCAHAVQGHERRQPPARACLPCPHAAPASTPALTNFSLALPPLLLLLLLALASLNCRGLDIYRVNDLLSAKGWHLNALQRPASLHICEPPQPPALRCRCPWLRCPCSRPRLR